MTAFVSLGTPYPMTRTLRVDVKQTRREDLKLERIFQNRHVQHIFEIPYLRRTAAERTTLDAWFVSLRGRYTNDIAFTDPWDSVVYTCRLDADALELSEESQGRWGATIRLVEVSGFKALKAAVTAFPVMASGAVVQFPWTMGRSYRTELQAQEDDTEIRYEDFASAAGIQRWAVGGDVLSNADATALLNAYEGSGGPWASWAMVDPQTGVTYPTCHFVESQCEHVLMEYGVSKCRLSVEELK